MCLKNMLEVLNLIKSNTRSSIKTAVNDYKPQGFEK